MQLSSESFRHSGGSISTDYEKSNGTSTVFSKIDLTDSEFRGHAPFRNQRLTGALPKAYTLRFNRERLIEACYS